MTTATYHHALSPGTRIESYEINHVLGVGGFGVTYRAFDHALQREVAMKEYLPTALAVRTPDGTTVTPKSDHDVESYEYGLKRFLDEARTLARFREPHIVRVLRYMEAHGTAYFVMDYEDGESLAALLKKVRTLDEETVRAIMVPILHSLRVVHEQKFLHRDIKPANIYVRSDGSPVLLDFGAARQALGEQSRAMTGMVTPGYAPFEQYFSRGKQGPWTDIYGIGATIYHCITGLAPIASTERVAALQDGEPDPIGDLNRLAGKRYRAVFLRAVSWMLAANAKERPQTIDEVLDVLVDEIETQALATKGAAPGLETDEPRVPPFPETVKLDELADTGAQWDAEVLKTVQLNLEQHIGPLSRALVRKAARKTANVAELAELLSRFIPSEQEKTVFLTRTRVMGPMRAVDDAGRQPASVAPAAAPAAQNAAVPVLPEDILQTAEAKLAMYVGPVARILVKKAALKTANLEEFCQILAQELPDEQQRDAFRQALIARMPRAH